MEELASTPTPKIVVRAADTDREEFDRILSSLDVSRTHEVFVAGHPGRTSSRLG